MAPPTNISGPGLDDDIIDDLLYYARTGDLQQLQADLASLLSRFNTTPLALVSAAVDEPSGNTLAHFACANGHLGACFGSLEF